MRILKYVRLVYRAISCYLFTAQACRRALIIALSVLGIILLLFFHEIVHFINIYRFETRIGRVILLETVKLAEYSLNFTLWHSRARNLSNTFSTNISSAVTVNLKGRGWRLRDFLHKKGGKMSGTRA